MSEQEQKEQLNALIRDKFAVKEKEKGWGQTMVLLFLISLTIIGTYTATKFIGSLFDECTSEVKTTRGN